MALSSAQIAQVMTALTGKVDNFTFQYVKDLLNLDTNQTTLPPGEPYQNIKNYSLRLRNRLQAMGTGITTHTPQDEILLVYMDVAKVKRLMARIPTNGYLAALPGIHTNTTTGTDQLTVSLLGCDNNLAILPTHLNNTLPGEESWGNCNIMSNLSIVLP